MQVVKIIRSFQKRPEKHKLKKNWKITQNRCLKYQFLFLV